MLWNESKFNELLKFYKDRYLDIQEQELYKWDAIQHFQDTWNIDAADFTNMIEKALSKIGNLGTSRGYNPHKGILIGARKDKESIRNLFRNLYDESYDVKKRISFFKDSANKILQSCSEFTGVQKQDVRAIVLYLVLRFPNKYYIYKSEMFKKINIFVENDLELDKKDPISKALAFFEVCNELRQTVIKDVELINLYKDRRNKYNDVEYHMLVQDIIYSVSYYENPEKLNKHLGARRIAKKSYVFTRPNNAQIGEFGTWKIINDNSVIKEIDHEFLNTYQAIIPTEVCWFFEAQELVVGGKLDIKISYEKREYDISIVKNDDSMEILMLWNDSLKNKFSQSLKSTLFYPYCKFVRKGEKQYDMLVEQGTKKRFEDALDESHSVEEREEHARQMDFDSLAEIARKQKNSILKKRNMIGQQMVRNPYIAEYAKRRANGICQLCLESAPFNKPNGDPYLESHHIIWLSEGGDDSAENTVALCPNCHRKMHVINAPEDVQKLKNVAEIIDG